MIIQIALKNLSQAPTVGFRGGGGGWGEKPQGYQCPCQGLTTLGECLHCVPGL